MHPFPHAKEIQFLVGAELEQVCLGRWQVHFIFDKARICVEGDLEHVGKSGTLHRHNTDENRLSPIYLHQLLGQKVQLIDVEPYCLSLAFDSGDIIRILSDEGPYECGQIYDEEGQVTVF
tara:strand:- start:203 stop:562 length:360 start_codon:yes stop_codon:yes gene_type:complete